jgi:hypothetical protein
VHWNPCLVIARGVAVTNLLYAHRGHAVAYSHFNVMAVVSKRKWAARHLCVCSRLEVQLYRVIAFDLFGLWRLERVRVMWLYCHAKLVAIRLLSLCFYCSLTNEIAGCWAHIIWYYPMAGIFLS